MPQNPTNQQGAAHFAKKRVLVADPDAANCGLLKKALASKGCEVGTTTTALGALDMLREDEYHLIIAEASMPDLDGFTLFETARYDPRTGRIPFIFLTANAAPEKRQRAVELGADGYLVKPVPAKELFSICSDLLRRSDSSLGGGGASDLSGRIGTFAVEEIVQILQAGGKTGHLIVKTPKATADIFFDRGQIFNANFAGIEGDEAIYLIFAVKEGHFSFRSGVKAPVRNVTTNVASLLLEGMRRMDEAREAVLGYQEHRNGSDDVVKIGESVDDSVPLEMKPFMPEEGGPSLAQVPAAALGGGETESDFAVSFDDEAIEEAPKDTPPQEGIPEPEPLPPGHGKRLAGAPPPPKPKGPPKPATPGGAPKRGSGQRSRGRK